MINDELENQENKGEINGLDDKKSGANCADFDIDKIVKEKEEYLDGWKRAKADLINYKKEEGKRFEATIKFANEAIIKDLIIALDSFDLAIVALEKESKAEKGIYLIKVQIEDVLKNYGLEKIFISVGQQFDPALHEAIAVIESDKPSGTIIEEVERGYSLNGKLIRPARVKVAK